MTVRLSLYVGLKKSWVKVVGLTRKEYMSTVLNRLTEGKEMTQKDGINQ